MTNIDVKYACLSFSEWRVESGGWRVKVENGEWRVESGGWRGKVENGEWRAGKPLQRHLGRTSGFKRG